MTPAKRRRARTSSDTRRQVGVKIEPFGPTAADMEALAQRVTKHRAVQTMLAKSRHRLLYIDLLDADAKIDKPKEPERFRATFYDYTNNRTVFAIGSLARPASLEVIESGLQFRPSQEEFDEAVQAVHDDPELGPAVREGRLIPYQAMPPLIGRELPDGTSERTIAVGLLPREGTRGHEIVGVRMAPREILRFGPTERGRAPLMAAAHNPICGLPYAGQPTASHVPGSVWVTVTQGGATVWRFLVVRPAASSGTNGSAVELKYLDYRGKRVLFRAHVPILNVKYNGNACGPYRDWQNQEGMIQANGTDVASGFRLFGTSASGDFTRTARSVRGLDSRRYRTPASATSIITMCIGDWTLTSARPATISCGSSTAHRSLAPRSGTTRTSRSAGRAIQLANANGGSRTSRRTKRTTSFRDRTMVWPQLCPTRRSVEVTSGFCDITEEKSTMAQWRPAHRTKPALIAGSMVNQSMAPTSWSGTVRISRTTSRMTILASSATWWART